MCRADYGRIVLTSSIGGLYGNHDVANYGVAKAGVIGLSNVAAIEGAAHNVTSNVIVPAAVTRMAEGIDTTAYPPMGADLVAPPSAGWRTKAVRSPAKCWWQSPAGSPAPTSPRHPACIGRPGPSRTSRHRSTTSATPPNPWCSPVVPDGHNAHIAYSFGMARPLTRVTIG